MPKITQRQMQQFVPEAYYTLWAERWGIDLEKYPYMKLDFDQSIHVKAPHCVWNFMILNEEDGHKVAQALVVYKSLVSKSYFNVCIYL